MMAMCNTTEPAHSMCSNGILVYKLLLLLHFYWTLVVYEDKRDRHQRQANEKIPFICLLSHTNSLLNKNVL